MKNRNHIFDSLVDNSQSRSVTVSNERKDKLGELSDVFVCFLSCFLFLFVWELTSFWPSKRIMNSLVFRVLLNLYYYKRVLKNDNFFLLLKESYCEVLHQYKNELSKPFDEATMFLTNIELELSNLCKGSFTVTSDSRSAMNGTFFLLPFIYFYFASVSWKIWLSFPPKIFLPYPNGYFCWDFCCFSICSRNNLWAT